MAAVLAAYSSELYPTRVRSHGTGLAAGASKAGGVVIIALVVASLAAPSITVTALLGSVHGSGDPPGHRLRSRDP
jgi:putative MFS transporter